MLLNFMVSTALGFLSGLGVGGGSLLLLWLTEFRKLDLQSARAATLVFFLPAALFASVEHFKDRKMHLSHVLYASVPGCIFAVISYHLFADLDNGFLRKLFGLFLLAYSFRELTAAWKNRSAS